MQNCTSIEAAVRPLWSRAPNQGRRTLSAISQVFDYATGLGYCTGNPADWRLMKHRFPRLQNGKHFAAMNCAEVPAFVRRLRVTQQRHTAFSPFGIEFLLLTACRVTEGAAMRCSEVDWDNRVWTIPASLTKSGREHRVPLSERVLTLLTQRQHCGGEYV